MLVEAVLAASPKGERPTRSWSPTLLQRSRPPSTTPSGYSARAPHRPPSNAGAEQQLQRRTPWKRAKWITRPAAEIVETAASRKVSWTHLRSQRLRWCSNVIKSVKAEWPHSNAGGYQVGSRAPRALCRVASLLGILSVNSLPPHYLCPRKHSRGGYRRRVDDGFDLPDKDALTAAPGCWWTATISP